MKSIIGTEDFTVETSFFKNAGKQPSINLVKALVNINGTSSDDEPLEPGMLQKKGSAVPSILSTHSRDAGIHLFQLPRMYPGGTVLKAERCPLAVSQWEHQQDPLLQRIQAGIGRLSKKGRLAME
jgi:hypothetical protein